MLFYHLFDTINKDSRSQLEWSSILLCSAISHLMCKARLWACIIAPYRGGKEACTCRPMGQTCIELVCFVFYFASIYLWVGWMYALLGMLGYEQRVLFINVCPVLKMA